MTRKTPTRSLSWPERADMATIETLRPAIESPVGRGLGAVSKVADQPPLVALSVLTWAIGAVSRNGDIVRAGTRMQLAHAIATLAVKVGKDQIDRSRPRAVLRKGKYEMGPGKSGSPELRSFPSGHTAGAFALAAVAGSQWPRWRNGLLAGAGALGALQMFRKAHFPTDILAGAAIGIVAGWLATKTGRRLDYVPPERLPAACRAG